MIVMDHLLVIVRNVGLMPIEQLMMNVTVTQTGEVMTVPTIWDSATQCAQPAPIRSPAKQTVISLMRRTRMIVMLDGSDLTVTSTPVTATLTFAWSAMRT